MQYKYVLHLRPGILDNQSPTFGAMTLRTDRKDGLQPAKSFEAETGGT